MSTQLPYCTQKGSDLLLSIKVSWGSKVNAFAGIEGNHLKIKIAARPVKGEANAALINFLASNLNISKSQISIKQGVASKIKTVLLKDVSQDDFLRIF